MDILVPITLKILLAARLQAIWDNRHAEVFTGMTDAALGIAAAMINGKGNLPLHGCWVGGSTGTEFLGPLFVQVRGALVVIRVLSSAIEAMLTVASFSRIYRHSSGIGGTIWSRLLHIKQFTPLLFVYHRDGTLFFFPILAISCLELMAYLELGSPVLSMIQWNIWVAFIYAALVGILAPIVAREDI
ncbi:hypothetical protein NP233_g11754 [Leucocoprinus birnbaumii]|uniref:Uncharacterized protein n=1 Tax=Leucocoprinus birnbaumii TaxID=56174 RepID=A0AAD5YQN0_9AGAR|nr:hypothetical protein NP233_g11754 [Leucocoprinus birnbaumii]